MANLVSIVTFENISGHNNKFYTMIERSNGTFDANYGPNDYTKWMKTKSYPIAEWISCKKIREAHGYNEIKNARIDIDKYVEYINRLKKSNLPDDVVSASVYMLMKYGELSKKAMEEINRTAQNK